jgi:hypothetical protein
MTIGPISGAIYTADDDDDYNTIISKRQSDLTFVWAIELTNSQLKYDSLISSNNENFLYLNDEEAFKMYKISTTEGNVVKSWSDSSFTAEEK